MKNNGLVKTLQIFVLFIHSIHGARLNHSKDDLEHHEHEHEDLVDTPHEHTHKHIIAKPAIKSPGKLRVLRKKKRTKFDKTYKERDWEGFYDSESDFNTIDIDNLETEGKDYPYESEDLTEYHSHPHEHLMTHDISSVYNKYQDLRPLDLTKLVPMVSLVGLYLLTPTYLNARKKRASFQISADGVPLNENDEKFECFLRLACRVGELSTEIGVEDNPLVAELGRNRKFTEIVAKYKEENKCNTSGCAEILTSIQ